jgi:hypothetical protein
MDAITKGALMAALVVAFSWPLANWANSELPLDVGGNLQQSLPIDSFLMSDEDLHYGD